eukprot:1541653-Prymnesium_polylepis.1
MPADDTSLTTESSVGSLRHMLARVRARLCAACGVPSVHPEAAAKSARHSVARSGDMMDGAR